MKNTENARSETLLEFGRLPSAPCSTLKPHARKHPLQHACPSARSHHRTLVVHGSARRRRQFPLLLVDVEAANGFAILVLVEGPPAHQALQLPVGLLLGCDFEDVVVLVQELFGVVADDESPRHVVSCHVMVGPIFAVLVGAIGHVEKVAVDAEQHAIALAVFGGQFLRCQRPHRLPEVFRHLNSFGPRHWPMAICEFEACDRLLRVLLEVRARLFFRALCQFELGILPAVEADEQLLFQLPLRC
mmetsp:Transcript_144170/g.461583  ORF Transcript_144170/g.461583 Transcript_144170/m.461583 type:complete len:245 (+) Transcript_144170:137-871(+)